MSTKQFEDCAREIEDLSSPSFILRLLAKEKFLNMNKEGMLREKESQETLRSGNGNLMHLWTVRQSCGLGLSKLKTRSRTLLQILIEKVLRAYACQFQSGREILLKKWLR